MTNKPPSSDRLQKIDEIVADEATPGRGPVSGFAPRRTSPTPNHVDERREPSDRPAQGDSSDLAVIVRPKTEEVPAEVSAVEKFERELQMIKRTTSTASLQAITSVSSSEPANLTDEIEGDSSIRKFPKETWKIWRSIIDELTAEAKKSALSKSGIDFHVKLRELKDAEENRSPAQKLLLSVRFPSLVKEKGQFTYGSGDDCHWSIVSFTEEDFNGAAPKVQAKNEATGETKSLELYYVLAGLKFGG